MTRTPAVPEGYARRLEGRAEIVALAGAAKSVAAAVDEGGTLYDFAARQPGARVLHGRAPVYAIALPGRAGRVVVRHSRHGGLLAPITGDRFVRPSRAPFELAAARRLARAGVPTPEIVAYVVYPAGPVLCRADVASREIADAHDLGDVLGDSGSARATEHWLPALATLLAAMTRAGARHPDLNVKNVLLAPGPGGDPLAYVLDVDRVEFGTPGDARVAGANVARLLRSARKRRGLGLARVGDAELDALAAQVAPHPA